MLDDASEDEEGEFITARLRLRRPRVADVPALTVAIDTPGVATGLVDVPYPFNRRDADEWIARWPAAGGNALVAIERESGQLVGGGSHRPADGLPGGCSLSFFVAESRWGHGLGTEIAHAVVDDAFMNDDVDRLWCAIRVSCRMARRVAEKCGFQFRDTGMVRSRAVRGMVPVERFVLDRRVWSSLKSWGKESRVPGHGRAAAAERATGDEDHASDAA